METAPTDELKKLLPQMYDFIIGSRLFRRVFLAVTVITIMLGPPFVSLFKHETQLTIFMSIVILMLCVVWDTLSKLMGGSSIQFFSDASLAQNALLNIAHRNSKLTEAFAIHYSGQNINHIILELQDIPSIKEITVFLQHPEQSVGSEQSEKIKTMVKAILRLWHSNKVHVQYYREPASVRGILINDVVLCIGWYTYQNAKDEGTLIWGHDTGAVLVSSDSEGFAPLRDFLCEFSTTLAIMKVKIKMIPFLLINFSRK